MGRGGGVVALILRARRSANQGRASGCAGSCELSERGRLASTVGHVVAHGSRGVRVQAARAGCAGSLLCRLVQSVGAGMKEAFERIARAGRVERTHDEDHGPTLQSVDTSPLWVWTTWLHLK